MRVVNDLKQDSSAFQRFHFNNSEEVKQWIEGSQRFHVNSNEVKHYCEQSQRFHFNSSEVNRVVNAVRHVSQLCT